MFRNAKNLYDVNSNKVMFGNYILWYSDKIVEGNFILYVKLKIFNLQLDVAT